MGNVPLKVSAERWMQAQEWEKAVWQAENTDSSRNLLVRTKSVAKQRLYGGDPNPGDDWNLWWAQKFGNYEILPIEFGNAVELGCGPYTNLRLILQGRRIEHVYCSDPLVKHYVTFSGRWLAKAWRQGDVLIDDHPLEDCPFASDYFDLVVLINVLDHVRDAILCLKQATRITRPGGYLVLGQDLTDLDDALRTGDDIGHPIRIDHPTLDQELMPHFEPVLHNIWPEKKVVTLQHTMVLTYSSAGNWVRRAAFQIHS